jgi:16S rRNA pseudouridine516 synthase
MPVCQTKRIHVKLRRLDQLLSSLGYASRREVDQMIDDGLVLVDGEEPRSSSDKVNPALVMVDGEPLESPDGLLAIFHKPLGCVCSHSDREGETIYDLLPERWPRRNPPVTSVGRLDRDTSGLLLMTDQGQLVQRYTSPKSSIEKVYRVTVDSDLDPELPDIFASGTLMLRSEETPCLPAKLDIVGAREGLLTLTEGRYHQVRRMFASQGWDVLTLHRERFGPYTLDGLAPGEWRLMDLSAA